MRRLLFNGRSPGLGVPPINLEKWYALAVLTAEDLVGEFNNVYSALNGPLTPSNTEQTQAEYLETEFADKDPDSGLYPIESSHWQEHLHLRWAIQQRGDAKHWCEVPSPTEAAREEINVTLTETPLLSVPTSLKYTFLWSGTEQPDFVIQKSILEELFGYVAIVFLENTNKDKELVVKIRVGDNARTKLVDITIPAGGSESYGIGNGQDPERLTIKSSSSHADTADLATLAEDIADGGHANLNTIIKTTKVDEAEAADTAVDIADGGHENLTAIIKGTKVDNAGSSDFCGSANVANDITGSTHGNLDTIIKGTKVDEAGTADLAKDITGSVHSALDAIIKGIKVDAALKADSATTAGTATNATTATSAVTADTAHDISGEKHDALDAIIKGTKVTNAITADSATIATNATNATNATKAASATTAETAADITGSDHGNLDTIIKGTTVNAAADITGSAHGNLDAIIKATIVDNATNAANAGSAGYADVALDIAGGNHNALDTIIKNTVVNKAADIDSASSHSVLNGIIKGIKVDNAVHADKTDSVDYAVHAKDISDKNPSYGVQPNLTDWFNTYLEQTLAQPKRAQTANDLFIFPNDADKPGTDKYLDGHLELWGPVERHPKRQYVTSLTTNVWGLRTSLINDSLGTIPASVFLIDPGSGPEGPTIWRYNGQPPSSDKPPIWELNPGEEIYFLIANLHTQFDIGPAVYTKVHNLGRVEGKVGKHSLGIGRCVGDNTYYGNTTYYHTLCPLTGTQGLVANASLYEELLYVIDPLGPTAHYQDKRAYIYQVQAFNGDNLPTITLGHQDGSPLFDTPAFFMIENLDSRGIVVYLVEQEGFQKKRIEIAGKMAGYNGSMVWVMVMPGKPSVVVNLGEVSNQRIGYNKLTNTLVRGGQTNGNSNCAPLNFVYGDQFSPSVFPTPTPNDPRAYGSLLYDDPAISCFVGTGYDFNINDMPNVHQKENQANIVLHKDQTQPYVLQVGGDPVLTAIIGDSYETGDPVAIQMGALTLPTLASFTFSKDYVGMTSVYAPVPRAIVYIIPPDLESAAEHLVFLYRDPRVDNVGPREGTKWMPLYDNAATIWLKNYSQFDMAFVNGNSSFGPTIMVPAGEWKSCAIGNAKSESETFVALSGGAL